MNWGEFLQAAILLAIGAGLTQLGAFVTRRQQRAESREQRDRDDRRHRWEIGREHAMKLSELVATERDAWYPQKLGKAADGQLGPQRQIEWAQLTQFRDHIERIPDVEFRHRAANVLQQIHMPSERELPEDLQDVPAMMQLKALEYLVDLAGAFLREERLADTSDPARVSAAVDRRSTADARSRRSLLAATEST